MINISSKLQISFERVNFSTLTLPFMHGQDVSISEGNCLTTATSKVTDNNECNNVPDDLIFSGAGFEFANGCWSRVADVNGFPSYHFSDVGGTYSLRLVRQTIPLPWNLDLGAGDLWIIVEGSASDTNAGSDVSPIYYNRSNSFDAPTNGWLIYTGPNNDLEFDVPEPPPTVKRYCDQDPTISSVVVSNSDNTPITLQGKVSLTLKSTKTGDLVGVKYVDTKGLSITFPTGSLSFECSSILHDNHLLCNDILTLEICSLCPDDKQDCCSEDKPSFIVTDQINSICVDAPCTCPLPTVVYFSSEQDTRLTVKHVNGSMLLDTGPVTTTNNVDRKLVVVDNQLYYSSTYFARIFPVSLRPVYVNTSSAATNFVDLPVYQDECGDTDYLKCHPLYFPSPSECINSKQGRCITKDNTVGDGYWIFYFNDCVEDLRFCINNTTGTNWTLEVEDGVGSTVKSLTQGGVSDTCFVGTTDICAYNMQFGSDINVNYSEEIYTPTEENLIDVSSRRQS